MKITHLLAENYKTYRKLDIDLSAKTDRPIILIGGCNGCGKTTLFDAIYGALYGCEITTPQQFEEILNDGTKLEKGIANQNIILEISFSGIAVGQEFQYKLRRTYTLIENRVRWNISLNINGMPISYGSESPANVRNTNEEKVNKIIAANLPSELSNYFLFDAMKTSDLVKEEQLNKLIMKNINSVMGFNKYQQLLTASDNLLAEKKAEKLENEKQRQEYEQLSHQRQGCETELKQLRDLYGQKLEFSNDNRERYQQIKQGRNADEMTRDRIKKQRDNILKTEQKAATYRDNLDKVIRDIEQNILYSALANFIRPEVESIVNERNQINQEQKDEISREQVAQLTQDIIDYLTSKNKLSNDNIDIKDIVRHVLFNRKHDNALSDRHPYLSNSDVEVLEKLIKDAYMNQFLPLDNERESIDQDIAELPRKYEQLANYEKELSGFDYNLIELYEANEQALSDLKKQIADKEKQIQELADKIATFDYDIPQVPDPQYDMLCKLPNLFRTISAKLLATKRKNIEQMMKEQLNLNLVVYAGVIGRVDLSSNGDEVNFKIYHKSGNEIRLSQLNAGAKQTVMQVLLKVLYELGDYNPPVMIDTVMGVLDKGSRDVILEHYFPDLAHQTILLSTDTEITAEQDLKKIALFVARTYTLHRDKEQQCSYISKDYFGVTNLD